MLTANITKCNIIVSKKF